MTKVGVPWQRMVVVKLETGRRQGLSVSELLALAYVLNVAPVHLLVPPLPAPLAPLDGGRDARPEDDPNDPNDTATTYQVTPEVSVPVYRVRQFIRGYRPLPGMDARAFFSEVPAHEFAGERLDEVIAAERRYRDEDARGAD